MIVRQRKKMKLTKHNVEQMARGHLMYEFVRRGYCVQITDSRFPSFHGRKWKSHAYLAGYDTENPAEKSGQLAVY
jgi:hypothetical protein